MKNYNLPIKHIDHEIIVKLGPYGPHHSKIICVKCNKFVKWATEQEYIIYQEITNENDNIRSKNDKCQDAI